MFERTGDLDALTEAIAFARTAVAATPAGHAHYPVYLSSLAAALLHHYDRTQSLGALTEAVSVGRESTQ